MNVAEVYTKYQIGRYIVEEEQSGNKRAEYGNQVLEGLSERLTARYGDGWSYSNLRQVRQFFLVYGNLTISDCQISSPPDFTLSWTHYLVLMRIKNADERRFYEIEATSGNWSVRDSAYRTMFEFLDDAVARRNVVVACNYILPR